MARRREPDFRHAIVEPPRGPAALFGGALLGAAAGTASLGCELAVLGWSGVGAPDGEGLAVLIGVYAVVGALLGGVHGATGVWGGGWALAWALGVAGLAVGTRMGASAASVGVPGAVGVLLGLGGALGLGQVLGRLGRAGPYQLAAATLIGAWCAVAGPLNLHLLPAPTDALSLTVDAAVFVLCLPVAVVVGLVSSGEGAPVPQLVLANALAWGAFWPNRPTEAPAPPHTEQSGRPIVLVTVEGLRSDVLTRERAPAPELTRLAVRSARFTRFQAAAPWSVPALGSIHTGRSPHHHGAAVHDGRMNRMGPLDATTLAQLLAREGHVTGAVVGDGWLDAFGLHTGFGWYVDTPDQGPLPWWVAAWSVAAGAPSWPVRLDAAAVTDRALAFAGAQQGGRWLLWAHYGDAGRPFLSAEHDRATVGKTARPWPVDAWEASVLGLDRELGRLVEGLPGDALIVLVGTHGLELEEGRDTVGLVPYGATDGHNLYQELIGVPLWVAGRGVAPRDHGRVVSGVDLLPTILTVAGVELPSALDGHELTELRGRAFDEVFEDLEDRAALSMAVRWGVEQLAARSGDDKIITRADGSDPLFDLAADPLEITARPADARNEQLERRLRGELPPDGASALFDRPPISERLGRWLTATWGRRAP